MCKVHVCWSSSITSDKAPDKSTAEVWGGKTPGLGCGGETF